MLEIQDIVHVHVVTICIHIRQSLRIVIHERIYLGLFFNVQLIQYH